jgi:glycosyltransferase involved in cell wall biosynthesis
VAIFPVRSFPREIWAIGSRAVADYRVVVSDAIPVRNLPYFADVDRFLEAAKRRTPSSRVRFLFCGSLNIRKGADIVAEATRVLDAEGHDFELHIAGTGPLAERFDELPERARSRLTRYGFLQLDDVPAAYAAADVLLFPSRHDGWGMTLGEGLAASMPAISTAQTGAAVDMLEDGRNGFVLPALTIESLASAMRYFLLNPNRIAAMGAAAQQTASQYTHRIGARRFIEAIRSATESPADRRN